MYRLKENIQDVKYFSASNFSFSYKLKNGSKVIGDKQIPNEYKYYGFLNENYIQYGLNEKYYLIDIQNNNEIEIPQVLFSKCFDGSKGFYTANYMYDKAIERSRSDLYKFEISTGISTKILTNSADILILKNGVNLIFLFPKTILKSLSLLTGEYEWEVDLSQYGKIRNILGVVGEELYVWLGHTTLVAVNIHDGLVQWHINTYETHKVGFDGGVHLLADERKVVLFHSVQYVEIDLISRKSELLYKTEFNQSWEFSANTVVGNYIYFVGRNYATDELSVGAFSRTSLQVEWYYAAPEWQGTVPDDYEGETVVLGNAPQVTEDKLYVLENGTGTLYIFEKENEKNTTL